MITSLYSLSWRWQTWAIALLSSWFYPFICISMSPILWPFLKRTFITYTLLSGQANFSSYSQCGNWGSRCHFYILNSLSFVMPGCSISNSTVNVSILYSKIEYAPCSKYQLIRLNIFKYMKSYNLLF